MFKGMMRQNWTEHSIMDNNLIAIIEIFVIISLLAGIICFVLGSFFGGGVGYNQGKKSRTKERMQRKRVSSV